jgi:hypothetical protein
MSIINLFLSQRPGLHTHLFSKKQDIDNFGFFASIFAWGNRTTIIIVQQLMQLWIWHLMNFVCTILHAT